MCCTRLAENTGRKNYAKNRRLCTIAQICRAISSQLTHVSTIEKKQLKQQYQLHMSSNMVDVGEPTAEMGSGVWGTPWQASTGLASCLRYRTDVAQWRSTKLSTMFGRLLG